MSRTGVEEKPPWRALPADVRQVAAALLGARVRRAERVYGGYSSAPTFRLLLADGRRAFVKATGPADTEFGRAALRREQRFYRDFCEAPVAAWMPALLGDAESGDWRMLLLQDLGPKSVPPWTPAAARGVARALAEFHTATSGGPFPPWLRPGRDVLRRNSGLWDELARTGEIEQVPALAADRDGAERWLAAALPSLSASARTLVDAPDPYALLHSDIRSDNLRWRGGRLTLFDWPHAFAGPPEYDLVEFAQSVTVEGGPPPEHVAATYAERRSLRVEVLTAAICALAAFFADAAWREPIPGLPRLRRFQQQQLAVTLAWAARLLDLPPPDRLWDRALTRAAG